MAIELIELAANSQISEMLAIRPPQLGGLGAFLGI
jgi:hypothetical protein